MKTNPYRPGALLLALLCASFPLASAAPATALAGPVPRHHHRHTAEDITRFLTGFYGDHGPSDQDRRRLVSRQLKHKQAHLPDTDVLLCSRSTPLHISVGTATVAQSAGVGWATVTTHWAEGTTDFTAYVRLDSRPIELDDVICAG
ncbi:hypothetical protein ABZZ17_01220 [Streptomyces sp. NPDC006512]|uniref:hypothetical protein n=1 Tax=Streptomyces sp. NPDC006512 TaxID=3154307 RepID=UPI0033B9014D